MLVKVCFAFVVLFAPTWLSGRKSPYWQLRKLVATDQVPDNSRPGPKLCAEDLLRVGETQDPTQHLPTGRWTEWGRKGEAVY